MGLIDNNGCSRKGEKGNLEHFKIERFSVEDLRINLPAAKLYKTSMWRGQKVF